MSNLFDFAARQARQTFQEVLPRNAAAAMLAIAAYQSARQLYRHEDRLWVDLPGAEKQVWIEMAQEWLQEVEPAKCSYCGARYKRRGSEYCDDQCAIFSERG